MNTSVVVAVLISLAVLTTARETGSNVSKANNEFALKLYKHLTKVEENLVCSPFSVSTILSVLLEGSPEITATHKEILESLEYEKFGLDLNKIENGYRELLHSLRSKNDVTLEFANSAWIKKTFSVNDDYKKVIKDVFKAEIKALRKRNATEDINKWLADRTKNKIRELSEKLDETVVMVLVNAIYFEAPWDKRFDERMNEEGARFKSNDDVNSADTVTLMKQRHNFPYYEDSNINARVLAMNYKGNEMKLAIFLPRDGHTLADLEASITADKIDKAINNANLREVSVAIPKFNLTSSLKLVETLREMGINKGFRDDAEFTRISGDGGIKVTKVIQKATIEVSENGTVAAATTSIDINLHSAVFSIDPPVEFRADHPFLYVLYHQPTKSTIFIGRLKNASSKVE